jgi:hypothetical protein
MRLLARPKILSAVEHLNRNTVLSLLFGASFFGLIAVFSIPDLFRYQTARVFQASAISYDSSQRAAPVELRNTVNSPVKSVEIVLRFRTRSAANYGNLFQTAPLNSGLRLELPRPGVLALIVGAQTSMGYARYYFTKPFADGRWHSFRVSIDRHNRIRAWIDGTKSTDQTNERLRYRITDIVFGSGFSKTLPFNGQIRDAGIAFDMYLLNPEGARYQTMAKIALFASGIVLLLLLGIFGTEPGTPADG